MVHNCHLLNCRTAIVIGLTEYNKHLDIALCLKKVVYACECMSDGGGNMIRKTNDLPPNTILDEEHWMVQQMQEGMKISLQITFYSWVIIQKVH